MAAILKRLRLSAVLVLVASATIAGCGGGALSVKSSQPLRIPGRPGQFYLTPQGIAAHKPGLAVPHRGQTLPRSWAPGAIPTVEMFDSVDNNLPGFTRFAAGYVDGSWATYWTFRGHYHVVIGISVRTRDGADCFDMEPGNPGPDSAGPWVKMQWRAGNAKPCLYTMLSWMPAVKANLAAWGIPRSRVRLWDANWTYTRHLDWGYDCTQFTDHAYNQNLDESMCSTTFFGQRPGPRPKPDPYAIYPKARFKLAFHKTAVEHNVVPSWDRHHCRNPVIRQVCKSDRFLMQLLRDRDIWRAHHKLVRGRWVYVRRGQWGINHLGARVQGLQRRIH